MHAKYTYPEGCCALSRASEGRVERREGPAFGSNGPAVRPIQPLLDCGRRLSWERGVNQTWWDVQASSSTTLQCNAIVNIMQGQPKVLDSDSRFQGTIKFESKLLSDLDRKRLDSHCGFGQRCVSHACYPTYHSLLQLFDVNADSALFGLLGPTP